MTPRPIRELQRSRSSRRRVRPPSSVTSHIRATVDRASPDRDLDQTPSLEWHVNIKAALRSGDWAGVRKQIELHVAAAKAALEAEADNQQRRSVKRPFWKRLAPRRQLQAKSDRHGLLHQDSEGRTPLHLALSSKNSPNDVLLGMIKLEPKAASVENVAQRVPLFYAVVHQHHIEVLAELIEAMPSALSCRDSKQISPLCYAVDIAVKEVEMKDAPRTYWMPAPDQTPEALWQESQGEKWGHVHWLLLSSATHPQTSLNVGGDKPMLVEALLHAAPPAVISLLIGASTIFLNEVNRASAFAGSTMYTCIHRHYPQSILYSLAAQCPREVRNVRDETGMGLVAAQFISACFEQKNNTDEWIVSTGFIVTLRESILNHRVSSDVAFADWWSKIKFLIVFCAGENPNAFPMEYILHAALTNSDMPPGIIQFLLALYPDALKIGYNKSGRDGALPVHLAAVLPPYMPRNYEKSIIGNCALDQILDADPASVFRRHKKRLPLHMAIAAGKVWSEIERLVDMHPEALCHRDFLTKLYPFQQAAIIGAPDTAQTFRWICEARNKYSSAAWRGLSAKQKAAAVTRVSEAYELQKLNTIYACLRRNSSVVGKSLVEPKKATKSREMESDTIASLFHSLCYAQDKDTGNWSVNEENMNLFNQACQQTKGALARLPESLLKWLKKLRFWIKYCAHGKENIPRGDDAYLLHSALTNCSNIPPPVIKFVLAMNPVAASIPLPSTSKLPLHFACETPSYNEHHFEVGNETSLELVLKSYPHAAACRFNMRLPLHLAIDAGKTWDELSVLIQENQIALKERDVRSALYPALQMAVEQRDKQDHYTRMHAVAKKRVQSNRWESLSSREHVLEIMKTMKTSELNVLTAIFGLLRTDPSVLRLGATQPTLDTVQKGTTESNTCVAEASSIVSRSQHDAIDETSKSEEATPGQNEPTSLSTLLSQQINLSRRGPTLEHDCDVSVFSNIDVMSTISNVGDGRQSLHTLTRHRTLTVGTMGSTVQDDSSSYEFAEDSLSCEELTQHENGLVSGAFSESIEARVYFQLRKKPREMIWPPDQECRPSRRTTFKDQDPSDSLDTSSATSISVLSLRQSLGRSRVKSQRCLMSWTQHSCASSSETYSTLESNDLKRAATGMAWVGSNVYGAPLLGRNNDDSESESDLLYSTNAGSLVSSNKPTLLPRTSSHSIISEVPSLEEDNRSVDMMWLNDPKDPQAEKVRKGKRPVPTSSNYKGRCELDDENKQTSLEKFLEDPRSLPDSRGHINDSADPNTLSTCETVDKNGNQGLIGAVWNSPNTVSTVSTNLNERMYFDPLSMRWKKRPKANQGYQQRPSNSDDEETESITVFDKTSMRWMTSTVEKNNSNSAEESIRGKVTSTESTKHDVLALSTSNNANVASQSCKDTAELETAGMAASTPSTVVGIRGETTPSTVVGIGGECGRKPKCLVCDKFLREVLVLPCSHLIICRHCDTPTVCQLCDTVVESKMLLF